MLHSHSLTAKFVINAQLRFHPLPLRDCRFEQVYEDFAVIAVVPFIPNLAKKVAPVVRIDGPIRDNGVRVSGVGGRGAVLRQRLHIPLLRCDCAENFRLNAWNELHLAGAHVSPEETVNVQGPLGIHTIDYGKRVERNAVLVE